MASWLVEVSLLGLGRLWMVLCVPSPEPYVRVCLCSVYLYWMSSGLETKGVLWFLVTRPPHFFGGETGERGRFLLDGRKEGGGETRKGWISFCILNESITERVNYNIIYTHTRMCVCMYMSNLVEGQKKVHQGALVEAKNTILAGC